MIKKSKGIKRHLILMMFLVSITVVASAFLNGYLVYLVWEPFSEDWGEVDENVEVGLEIADFIWVLLMALSGLIISIIIAYRVSRKILVSIHALGETAQAIADGNLSARIKNNPDVKFTELIQLEHNFNIMATQLEQKQNNLNLWNAGIAHELRTPVTILKGRLQGILDGVFEPDEALIQTLLKQTENLSRLIEDLRLLSLIENNHLRLSLATVNINEIIEEQLNLFALPFQEKGLQPVLNLEQATLECDPIRMQQILAALLENSVRYSNSGKLYLTTKIINNEWIFMLEDEGPGISEEEQAHIFEFFYRANHPDCKKTQGTGLGLTIIKHLIEAHKGSLSYERSQYGGSCFKIVIPI